ncbi:MAG: DNA starvation/stationary phase protection protein, partial [Hyphomonas sp.]|nr:DNA starvation/stationary phase protection protein [Hyphomonas sp.]
IAELAALGGAEAAPAQSAGAMVAALLEAHTAMAEDLRAAITVAQEAGDEVTAGFLTDRLEWHEKELWMLRASVQ